MQRLGKIHLTADEDEILTQVRFPARGASLEFEENERNGRLVSRLIKSLLAREAIPRVRMRFYADPEFNPSHPGCSRREMFLRSTHSDEQAYRHQAFLRYLHYFIHGPDLPEDIKDKFFETASEHFVEVNELEEKARWLIRTSDVQRYPRDYELHEKFYQLALDCGCAEGDARRVRKAVMTLR